VDVVFGPTLTDAATPAALSSPRSMKRRNDPSVRFTERLWTHCQCIDVEVFSTSHSSLRAARPLMTSSRQQLRARTLDGIRALVGSLTRSARSVEQRTGVTTAQLFVLRQLAESDGLSLGEIADRTLTRQSTVSVVVGRLVKAGLVHRQRADDDRRRLELSLTGAGRRLLGRAPMPTTGRLLAALDELSEDQLRSLSIGLDSLIGKLGVESRRAGMLFEGS